MTPCTGSSLTITLGLLIVHVERTVCGLSIAIIGAESGSDNKRNRGSWSAELLERFSRLHGGLTVLGEIHCYGDHVSVRHEPCAQLAISASLPAEYREVWKSVLYAPNSREAVLAIGRALPALTGSSSVMLEASHRITSYGERRQSPRNLRKRC